MPNPVGRPQRCATNVDQHVGSRIKERRVLLGLNQSQLGEKLNITFQQIQKYEKGFNRVGASRLFELARVLNVPITFFFDGLDQGVEIVQRSEATAAGPDPLTRRETLELVRAYYQIQDPRTRHALVVLIRQMVGLQDPEQQLPAAAD
jgi:transcriptional regulator with XRE-family HTH domain